jgi:2'-5' RNA ligase
MEEFRFHMTLTSRLQGEESEAIGSALASLVEPLTRAPLEIDAISLFYQETAQTAFRIVRRYPLTG